MKNILFIVIFSFLAQSCALFNYNTTCKKYYSNQNFFRVYSESLSSTPMLAETKAINTAKEKLKLLIDDFIIAQCNYKHFLNDSEYEIKVDIIRRNALKDCSIICSKIKKKGNLFKSHVTLEVSKTTINKEIINSFK